MDEKCQYSLSPIGFFYTNAIYPYDVPRQSSIEDCVGGIIQLLSKKSFELCIQDIEGFERIWIIYWFHNNDQNWKPKVLPPRNNDKNKKGLFATRAPRRPNPLGLSCVALKQVIGLQLYVEEADLLNNTPILDIKPYLPYCDSFPSVRIGWLENIEKYSYHIEIPSDVTKKISWIESHSSLNLSAFIRKHLSYQPTSFHHKHVRPTLQSDVFILYIKQWKIYFSIHNNDHQNSIYIIDIINNSPENAVDSEITIQQEFQACFS